MRQETVRCAKWSVLFCGVFVFVRLTTPDLLQSWHTILTIYSVSVLCIAGLVRLSYGFDSSPAAQAYTYQVVCVGLALCPLSPVLFLVALAFVLIPYIVPGLPFLMGACDPLSAAQACVGIPVDIWRTLLCLLLCVPPPNGTPPLLWQVAHTPFTLYRWSSRIPRAPPLMSCI